MIETQLPILLEDQGSPGCYGKIPATGDFIMRRLPPGFVKQWDLWLQQSIEMSRALLGEDWDGIYLTAPIWRFALAPGACGDDAWAGVLMPSVDKVGRKFPLTLAARLIGVRQLGLAILECGGWFAHLEEIALSTLRADCEIDALDEALCTSHFPAGNNSAPAHNDDQPAMQRLTQSHELPLALANVGEFAELLTEAAVEALSSAHQWRSYWWTRGRSESAAAALVSTSLPDARMFTNMLSI